jgi:hypothetical protein
VAEESNVRLVLVKTIFLCSDLDLELLLKLVLMLQTVLEIGSDSDMVYITTIKVYISTSAFV